MLHPFRISISLSASIWLAVVAGAAELKKVEDSSDRVPIPMHSVGRVVKTSAGAAAYRFQWPGIYFESQFAGSRLFVETGNGRAIFHVLVDNSAPLVLINAERGVYEVAGLAGGTHNVRLELVTECQGGVAEFVGFSVPSAGSAKPSSASPSPRSRRIEFIGDSHTVGYGNTSSKRQCTGDEIWATTDTSRCFGPLVAKHYDADYEINAISGRGIVRNYNGGKGDPLPDAYEFALFDHRTPVEDPQWSPNVIVIGLGTNDFSTKLNTGEPWKSREELHASYEQRYAEFVSRLRTHHPKALIILTSNGMADGEIAREVSAVLARLKKAGETRVDYVEFGNLELTACDWHPSLNDDVAMAGAIEQAIDRHPDAWTGK